MKQCNKCKESKPLSEFSPDIRSKDKLSKRCKECAADHSKEYRKKKANLGKVTRVQNALIKYAEGADNLMEAAYSTGKFKTKKSASASISRDLTTLSPEEMELAVNTIKHNPKMINWWEKWEKRVFEESGTASEMRDFLKLFHDIRGDIKQKHEITPMRNIEQQREQILAEVYAASQKDKKDDSGE